MKVCICGIGGAGGKIASNFLRNVDLNSKLLSWFTDAKCVSSGKMMGIWLDADYNDAKNNQHFFKDLREGGYPGYFIPHEVIPAMCELHKVVRKKYGYNVKKQGFVRDAQYLKAIYEIFDSDIEIQKSAAEGNYAGMNAIKAEANRFQNPIFDNAWEAIAPYTVLGGGYCDVILFIVSFGGGTGTGFINPIIDHIREGGATDYPVFVLGVLTEPGDLKEGGQFSLEGQRYLAAINALYDLLTKRNGANGVILIDNELLKKRVEGGYPSQNKFIYDLMKPMVSDRDYPGENPVGQAMEKEYTRGLTWTPIFVPAYWIEPRREGNEVVLVEKALKDGKLFDCSEGKADKAFVFCRGFIDSNKIGLALSAKGIKNAHVFRKLGEGNYDEILILLRNPYGCDPDAHERDGTLEKKFCKIIDSALNYMDRNVEDLFYEGKNSQKTVETEDDVAVKLTKPSRDALTQFFFGKEGYIKDNIGTKEGFAFELREARKRLEAGKKKPSEEPFFLKPLRIFKKDNNNQYGRDSGYIFSWSKIPGDEDNAFIEFLTKKIDVDWVRKAKIEKVDGGTHIKVFTEKNSLSLKLNNDKTKATLEVDDGKIDEFITRMENGELNIYKVGTEAGLGRDELSKINERLVELERLIKIKGGS